MNDGRYVGMALRDHGVDVPGSFDAFRAEALAAGYDEVLVREWKPGTVVDTHAHPFDAEAVVMQGELWLREGDRVRHLEKGGNFRLPAGAPHAEKYGAEGATYWVARRRPG